MMVEKREHRPVKRGRSMDGYIVDQARLTDMPYGRRMSSRNGCGWIAAYNFLRAHGVPVGEEQVSAALAKGSLFRGLLGTSPLRVRAYLRRMGFATSLRLVRRGGACDTGGADGGVALYRHGGGWHFVAFAGAPAAGKWRFFNAEPGSEAHVETMETFLLRHARFPLALLFLDRGPGDRKA